MAGNILAEQLRLMNNRDIKNMTIQLIVSQIMELQSEINFNEGLIRGKIESIKRLQCESQEVSDKLLEIEYNSLKNDE